MADDTKIYYFLLSSWRGAYHTVDLAKGGVLMLIYIIEVVGVVFFCILKETWATLETELQLLLVRSQKLQDEMVIKQTDFGQEALHKLSCRI